MLSIMFDDEACQSTADTHFDIGVIYLVKIRTDPTLQLVTGQIRKFPSTQPLRYRTHTIPRMWVR